eukprot:snap_masked-scaffold_19-processed-gene-4.26-mRNA-1 protein AED:1.00 eAED:1.00 QI:0/0/0/0/1/1/2/0/74
MNQKREIASAIPVSSPSSKPDLEKNNLEIEKEKGQGNHDKICINDSLEKQDERAKKELHCFYIGTRFVRGNLPE